MIFSFSNSGFRDPETGVYNQTYFMEVFNREWHRHARDCQSLALLYISPHIHDSIKHPHLLECFTQQLQEALLRSTDLIARINHNRFALGLFNITEAGTETVLKRIDEHITKFNNEFIKDHAYSIEYKVVACVCLPQQQERIENLFTYVDKQLIDLEHTNSRHSALYSLH